MKGGLPGIDDMIFHIFQTNQFVRSVQDGFLYPRWTVDSINGYGSPNFIFYSPMSYYFVTVLYCLVPSVGAAMILAAWFGFFFSGVTFLFAARGIFGRSGVIFPAVLYQILPFHLRDLYARGAFAELFAFIWFPLVIFFLHDVLANRNTRSVIGLAFSYAGLILTHLVSGYIFSFVIGLYLIYFFSLKRLKSFQAPLAIILGLCLSSFYLVPAVFERKLVHIDYIINCACGDYTKNFLFTGDKFHADLSVFYLPLHVGIVLEMLVFFGVIFSMRSNDKIFGDNTLNFFAVSFLGAFFLTLPLSAPVWKIIPGFSYLQFPWRWVSVMEVFLCFLLGGFFSATNSDGGDTLRRMTFYTLLSLLVMSGIIIYKGSMPSQQFFDKADIDRGELSPTSVLEYVPKWAKDPRRILYGTKSEKISVVAGMASTVVDEWKSELRVIRAYAPAPSTLRIHTFYYPGWKATIDGRRTEIRPDEEGAMLISLPAGQHILELQFADTALRRHSKIVSLISLLGILFWAGLEGRKNWHSKKMDQRQFST
jgi:hypothetical protein